MIKRGATGVLVAIFVLVAIAIFASSAFAGPAGGIIKDASDGVVDGSYSSAAVRAALKLVRTDPVYSQYSDIEGVLADYLSGFGVVATSSGSGGSGSSGSGSGGSGSGSDGGSGTSASNAQASAAGSAPAGAGRGGTRASGGSGTPVSIAGLAPPPVPDVSGTTLARSRLGVLPWFFALLALGLAAGILLLRIRRAG